MRDFSAYSPLLRRCAVDKSLEGTKAVHAHIVRSGFPHLALGNKLVDAYLKSGSVLYARRVFDEMPARHIVAWNSMLASYARRGFWPEAVGLYRRMLLAGVSPDGYTFSSVLTALAEAGSLGAGRQVHAHLVVSAATEPLFVSTALVNLYGKLGEPGPARLVFDRAADKDVVLGTALVVGCAQAGQPAEAARAFADMRRLGIPGNEFTFASVLVACGDMADPALGRCVHGLAIESGLDRGSSTQTSLMVMYSRCARLQDSLRVYAGMAEAELNLVARTAAMGALAASRREDEALSAFHALQRRHRPNAFALSTALRACSSSAQLRCGQQLHALAAKMGIAETHPFVGAALVDLYGKCGRADAAELVFGGLPGPGCDPVAVNAMIAAYAASGRGQAAVRLFDEAAASSAWSPSPATFTAVLSACSAAGLVEPGRRIFSSIADPSGDHVACFVDLLARGGRLAEAEQVLALRAGGDPVPWRALLAACKLHGKVETAERAARRVLELSPPSGDGGAMILLSNVYAAARQWRKAADARQAARGMALKSKDPGVSWVHHSFVAGVADKAGDLN
ncbi:pentatricopeptide repeat-containing protein At5g65570-like [Wolffia australiana]